MTNYGTRPDPAATWKMLDDMMLTNPSQRIVMTRHVYDIIRNHARGEIADHEYKNGIIDRLTTQLEFYKKMGTEPGRLSMEKFYEGIASDETDTAIIGDRTGNLRDRLRTIAVDRHATNRDLVEAGAIINALLYLEYRQNLNVEILSAIESFDVPED